MEFWELVKFLSKAGYTCQVSWVDTYWFCKVDKVYWHNPSITAGFVCEPDDNCYEVLKENFCADHSDHFDKWTKCDLIIRMPKNETEATKLLNCLKILEEFPEEDSSFNQNLRYGDNYYGT